MGGAERSARKRRQSQTAGNRAPAVAQHKSADRKPIIIGVVVVVVLLGAVLGGVIYTNNRKNTTEGESIATSQLDEAATSAAGADTAFPVKRDDAVVVAGKNTAKATIDVYEDFLCPICRGFEASYGADMERHMAAGDLKVRYHMLPLLNERSDPPGYSLDAANAGLCAADAGKFPEFHKALYNAQPEEGSRGWDKQQLAKLGQDLGIKSDAFKSCVESSKYNGIIQSHFEQVRNTPYLQQDLGGGQQGFGTPTVAKGQKVVDTSNPKWLDEVVGGTS
ncbi:MAG TPA: thioredoxin domain-containing protein [Actinophytocola sp.]|uniref:DsbA family protein n=1 Tax=Actinophytocola sp. TaxID=1872138 RepID=UPI002F941DAB